MRDRRDTSSELFSGHEHGLQALDEQAHGKGGDERARADSVKISEKDEADRGGRDDAAHVVGDLDGRERTSRHDRGGKHGAVDRLEDEARAKLQKNARRDDDVRQERGTPARNGTLDGDAGENRHPGVDHRAEEKDGWELQPLAALEP